jgi:hypothetical protein
MRKHVTVLLACVAIVGRCVAQEPVNPSGEAAATVAAVDDARILTAVNRLKLKKSQARKIMTELEQLEKKRAETAKSNQEALAKAEAALRDDLPRIVAEPSYRSQAEGQVENLLAQRRAQDAQAERAARDEVVHILLRRLTPGQKQEMLAIAREEAVQSRLEAAEEEGAADLEDALGTVDKLRQSEAAYYQSRRDSAARRLAGFRSSQLMRSFLRSLKSGGDDQGRELPAATDPSVKQRLDQYVTVLDRARAVPDAAWRQQRRALASELLRQREIGRAQLMTEEELAELFANEFLLKPGSLSAMRARYPNIKTDKDEGDQPRSTL